MVREWRRAEMGERDGDVATTSSPSLFCEMCTARPLSLNLPLQLFILKGRGGTLFVSQQRS